MSRTTSYGITRESIAAGPVNSVIYVGTTGRLTSNNTLIPKVGGTGIDSSNSVGVAKVLAGTWSVDYIKAADFGQPYSEGLVLGVHGDGSLSWVTSGSGPSAETVTHVSVLNYNVQGADMNLAIDSSIGPVTINLQEITGTRRLGIIDSAGFASENNITVVPFLGNNIMRSTDSLILPNDNVSVSLLSVSANNWHIVSKN